MSIGVEFDPDTGKLYGLLDGNDLYEIDLTTGKATLIKSDLLVWAASLAAKFPKAVPVPEFPSLIVPLSIIAGITLLMISRFAS